MTQHRDLAFGQPLPESWVDRIQEFIGSVVQNFDLTQVAGQPAQLQVPAGAGNAQAAVGITGRWRYVSAPVTGTGPGGAAAYHDVWVTATDNAFAPGPEPAADNTDYSFALEIRAAGTPLAPLSRKMAVATWDGAKYIAVYPLWREPGAIVGQVIDFAGDITAICPYGFLPADAAPVSRTTYAKLFAAIGTKYGAGDGSATFNTPDGRGRPTYGVGTNADVNAVGKADGLAASARTPKHKHFVPWAFAENGGGGNFIDMIRTLSAAAWGATGYTLRYRASVTEGWGHTNAKLKALPSAGAAVDPRTDIADVYDVASADGNAPYLVVSKIVRAF